ncbi:MAG: helix-turn-helix transcriptional regulator [Acetobacteraceae bacterium]|nr:helix-turn-helix transcriptional regulator [Acetobacteraceae bacterium]
MVRTSRSKPASGAKRTAPPLRLSERQALAIARALSDPRRFGILREVAAASDSLPCCALQAAASVSAATISHHIKGLEAAGLIKVSRDGKFAMLTYRQATFDAYVDYMAASLNPLESGSRRNT